MKSKQKKEEKPKRPFPLIPTIFAGIVILVFAALVWRSYRKVNLQEFLQDSAQQHYNILIVTIDTLRGDRLGCYGFKDISTPNIDALAEQGTRFVDTTAHAPMTLPSHTSIMTGHFPSFHGVHDNGGFYVPKSVTTMAEQFKKSGFQTAAFVSAYVLDSTWGLDQGFDTYFDNFDLSKEDRVGLGSVQRPGDETLSHALDWLDKNQQKRFFLWIHFYDPHTPYEPPQPYQDLYPGRPYLGEIAFTDSLIGKLTKYLDDHDLRKNTVLLLTGDHGESLGQHGEGTHTFFVYDATLRVPLIIVAPRKELRSKVVLGQARSVDIYPTLLQMAGVQVPEDTQGRSLLHLAFESLNAESPPSYAEAYYPQYHFGWSRLLSLRTSQYKYIDAPKPELYDLKKDPDELSNIYPSHKQLAQEMRSELKKIEDVKSENATIEPGAVDDETHEKLAALGYVGAFNGPVNADPLTLPDPKDKIELFNLLTSAREDSLDEKPDSAIKKFQQALAADPGIVDAHFMLGNEYFRQDKYEQAVEEFKKALELKPDYDFAMINLANTYRKMGRIKDALSGFEYFLAKNPENTQVLYHIGEIYLSIGEPDKALDFLNRALKVDPETSWVFCGMGVAYLQKKENAKARELFEKALAENPEINMAHFNLAQLDESDGDLAGAEKEYQTELKIYPKNFKAHFNLGRQYMEQGRLQDGIEHLKSTVDLAPEFALGYLFLAQAYVESGEELQKAADLAEKGLSLNPDREYRPLGHLVLADIYNRMGRHDLEQKQLALAHSQ